MTPLRRKSGLYLCRCSLAKGFDPTPLAPLDAIVELAPDASALPGFAARLRKGYAEQVLYACRCTPVTQLEEACAAVGIAPEVHALDLYGATLAVSDPAEASAKALRLILGVLAGLDQHTPVPHNPLQVGGRVALFADRPEGMALARSLPAEAALVVFLEGEREAFGSAVRGVNWGRPEAVRGRLGAFAVTVAPQPGSDFTAPQQVQADQVIVLGGRAEAMPRHTGLHRLPAADAAALEATAAQVGELIGTFQKPVHVQYDATRCAGGAAERQACGRCIPACPYDAIARDPANALRVHVEHLACEGCGACTSACPTSALTFTEPAPEALYARVAGHLAREVGNGVSAPAIMFHCEQQGRALLEWAAAEGERLPAQLLPVEVPCLRYVSEAAMLGAVRLGAAGVALLGCEACPHGERALLLDKLELTQRLLGAAKLDPQRVRLLTVAPDARADALAALRTFGAGLGAPLVPPDGRPIRQAGNREVLAEAVGALVGVAGKDIGGVPLKAGAPFARAEVNAKGCTLCRACATVCPTHAFAFEESSQSLHFKHIACVNCGLCAQVCPEQVITLHPALHLERAALDYVTVAEDELVRCARCDKPYINRRALETVEARLRGAVGVGDTFTGKRVGLLRMCPDCRAAAAMLEIRDGWQP